MRQMLLEGEEQPLAASTENSPSICHMTQTASFASPNQRKNARLELHLDGEQRARFFRDA